VGERRRRRIVGEREAQASGGAPRVRTASGTAAAPSRRAEPVTPVDDSWAGAEVDPATAERGLRGLVGGGSSQVSPGAALRARDAARPTSEDLARAEVDLRIVRRNWTPRD
jgi:hypothetical protein